MRDLNENGQYFNCFMPMAQNGYLECDKEVLKQIILQHEAIFRKQVCLMCYFQTKVCI